MIPFIDPLRCIPGYKMANQVCSYLSETIVTTAKKTKNWVLPRLPNILVGCTAMTGACFGISAMDGEKGRTSRLVDLFLSVGAFTCAHAMYRLDQEAKEKRAVGPILQKIEKIVDIFYAEANLIRKLNKKIISLNQSFDSFSNQHISCLQRADLHIIEIRNTLAQQGWAQIPSSNAYLYFIRCGQQRSAILDEYARLRAELYRCSKETQKLIKNTLFSYKILTFLQKQVNGHIQFLFQNHRKTWNGVVQQSPDTNIEHFRQALREIFISLTENLRTYSSLLNIRPLSIRTLLKITLLVPLPIEENQSG